MIKAVIFDCDGTIYDTRGAGDVGDRIALKKTFDELGIGARVPSLKELQGMMGYYYFDYYKKLIPEQYWDKGIPLALKHQKKEVSSLILKKKGKIYNGVMRTLKGLKKIGIRLALVTNADSTYISSVSRAYGFSKIFDFITSADRAKGGKPELLAIAIKKFKIKPENAIMVGDRKSDMDAARLAGCRAVAVTYGFGKKEELEDANFKIGKIEELVGIVENEKRT